MNCYFPGRYPQGSNFTTVWVLKEIYHSLSSYRPRDNDVSLPSPNGLVERFNCSLKSSDIVMRRWMKTPVVGMRYCLLFVCREDPKIHFFTDLCRGRLEYGGPLDVMKEAWTHCMSIYSSELPLCCVISRRKALFISNLPFNFVSATAKAWAIVSTGVPGYLKIVGLLCWITTRS